MKKAPGPTPFQQRVFAAVLRIPHGKVASYAAIASAIDCRSARVIGQALRFCQDDTVPCHRVVAADLTIGGFGGRNSGAQVKKKRARLEAEGVKFDRSGHIDPACAIRDSPAARWLGGSEGQPQRTQRAQR